MRPSIASLGLLLPAAACAAGWAPVSLDAAAAPTAGLVAFEENRGQFAATARFLARGAATPTVLRADGADFLLPGPRREVLKLRLPVAAPPRGEAVTGAESHYFGGGDPAAWRVGVPRFGRVRYPAAFPGIDLVFHSQGRSLEYDLEVAPGADPGLIGLTFSGPPPVLHADGHLEFGGPAGLRHERPQAYQLRAGRREAVPAWFRLTDGGRVGFRVGSYDRQRALVIDPTVAYTTYLGGLDEDAARGLVANGKGHAFVTGWTRSNDFPGLRVPLPGGQLGGADAFISRVTPDGRLQWTAYLAGTGDDFGEDIALDPQGNLLVTGRTASGNFPTVKALQPTSGGGEDAFLARVKANGKKLLAATYLGGSGADGASGLAVDHKGDAYLTGETGSPDFPTSVGAFQTDLAGETDVFVTRIGFSKKGAMRSVYSTYLGGVGADDGVRIAVDRNRCACAVGHTTSADFPVVPGSHGAPTVEEIWVTRLAADGASLLHSGRFGGGWMGAGALDSVGGVAVDAEGGAYVVGLTYADSFPLRNPLPGSVGWDGTGQAFIFRLTADGTDLVFSTEFGGPGTEMMPGGFDAAWAVTLGKDGSIYVAGATTSTNLPLEGPVFSGPPQGRDAFVLRLSADGGTILGSTYLDGGTGDEEPRAIAVSKRGDVYVAGKTPSADLPTTSFVLQPGYGGGSTDGWLTRLAK